MNDSLRYLLYFVAAYAGFRLLIALVVFVQILRMQLWPAKVRWLEQAPQLAPDEAAAAEELRGLGFAQVAAALVEYGPTVYKSLLLRHASEPVYAALAFQPGGNLGYPVTFYTFLADGRLLATNNRLAWAIFGSPPEVVREDPCVASLQAHWEAHLARLKGCTPAQVGEEEAMRRVSALTEDYLSLLQAQGRCTRDGNAWHPSLGAAARAALLWARLRPRLARPYVSAVTSGEHQVGYFVHCYSAVEGMQAARPARHNVKATMLVLSIVAAALLWGLAFNWTLAVMLVAILFVHESGHALMMRLFGYQDMSMFFIPFIGAVVTGKPRELPAWKQALILFAGPVPGLLAGVAILLLAMRHALPDWGFDWHMLGGMAVTVNLFNLLPIAPLDGGQLVGISLFNRWPLSRLLFGIAGVLGIAALAWLLKSPATVFITVVLLLGVRSQFRMMQLHQAWDDALDRPAQLRHLFETAKRRFAVQGYATQAALVKAVVTQHAVRKARWWESAAILSVLLVFWSGTAVAALAVWEPAQLWRLTGHRAAAVEARTPAQAAFDTAWDEEQDSDADMNLARLDQLAAALAADDPRRVDMAYMRLPQEPYAARHAQLEAMLAVHAGGHQRSLSDMEQGWLREVHEHAAGGTPQQEAAALGEAIDRAMRLVPKGYADTVQARLRLAEAVDRGGDSARAQALLDELHAHAAGDGGCRCELPAIVGAQARFRLAHAEPAAAVAVIESSYPGKGIEDHSALHIDYAWALLGAGRIAQGVEWMQRAAFYRLPQPGLVQRLLGAPAREEFVVQPLAMAYAWHQAGQDEKIGTLDHAALGADCKVYSPGAAPDPDMAPWQGPREAALTAFAATVCTGEYAPAG